MSLLLIFLFGATALAAVYLAITPFLGSREQQAREELIDDELKRVEQLVATKSVLLQSLREIEFEFETAKMAKEDYERFRTSLERQAIGVMRKLDEIHGGRGWELQIDQELAERLGRPMEAERPDAQSALAEPAVSDPFEEAAEETKYEEKHIEDTDESEASEPGEDPAEGPGLTCESCGDPLGENDKFCSECGAPVIAQLETRDKVAG